MVHGSIYSRKKIPHPIPCDRKATIKMRSEPPPRGIHSLDHQENTEEALEKAVICVVVGQAYEMRREFSRAMSMYRQAFYFSPTDPEAAYHWLSCALMIGDIGEAQEARNQISVFVGEKNGIEADREAPSAGVVLAITRGLEKKQITQNNIKKWSQRNLQGRTENLNTCPIKNLEEFAVPAQT